VRVGARSVRVEARGVRAEARGVRVEARGVRVGTSGVRVEARACESRPAACRFQSGYARGVLDCWRETGGYGRNPLVAARSPQGRTATHRDVPTAKLCTQHCRTSVRRLASLQRRPSPPTRSRPTGANCRGEWERGAGGTAPARGAVTRLPSLKRAACRRRASSRVAGRGRCGWRCPRRASCRGCGRTCCS
jgi:hypothetical protein